jgi:hypothetical protein
MTGDDEPLELRLPRAARAEAVQGCGSGFRAPFPLIRRQRRRRAIRGG